MMSSITTVVAVLVLLAFLPVTIKWIQRRIGGDSTRVVQASSVVSAVAFGPSQLVVTVEALVSGCARGRTRGKFPSALSFGYFLTLFKRNSRGLCA